MTAVKRALAGLALALLLVTVDAAPGYAWSPIDSSRPTWCGAAPYALGRTSSDLGDATSESEARRGMEDWSLLDCSGLETTYQGRTSAVAGVGDGVSMIGWVESGWRHDSNAIGVTVPRWNFRGCIVEADMEMNGVFNVWTTGPGRFNEVNAYSIALHEGGHYFGLGHSQNQDATMFFAYTGGIDRITSDDRVGICTLYPGSGGVIEPECSTASPCGAGMVCEGGVCVPGGGDGSVCSPCRSDDDCGGPNDFCLEYPDGRGFCGRVCQGSAECNGDVCVSIDGVGQCIRTDANGFPTCTATSPGEPNCRNDTDCGSSELCSSGDCIARPSDRAPLGGSCAEDSECNSGLCFQGICSESCNWLSTTSCPSGFYCDGNATGSCGTGLCLAGVAGGGELGSPCSEDTDCRSLYCDGVCALPCIPGGATGCPEGLECQTGASAGCGSCKVAGAMGDTCAVNEDCISRMCAQQGDGTPFCTDICTAREDCPAGFACLSAGIYSVCAPPNDGPAPGTLGFPCDHNGDCDSHVCAQRAEGETFCTAVCSEEAPCPSGYMCESAGDESVCAPTGGRGGRSGGCGVIRGRSGSGLGAFAGFFLLLGFLRRRRRSIC